MRQLAPSNILSGEVAAFYVVCSALVWFGRLWDSRLDHSALPLIPCISSCSNCDSLAADMAHVMYRQDSVRGIKKPNLRLV